MPRYCVNTQAQAKSGDHEVHDLASTYGCLPNPEHRRDLGYHPTCREAVAAAKQVYRDSNGCYHCARPCHTT